METILKERNPRMRAVSAKSPPPNDPDPMVVMVKQLLSSTLAEIPNKFDCDASASNQLDSLDGENKGSEGRLSFFEQRSFACERHLLFYSQWQANRPQNHQYLKHTHFLA